MAMAETHVVVIAPAELCGVLRVYRRGDACPGLSHGSRERQFPALSMARLVAADLGSLVASADRHHDWHRRGRDLVHLNESFDVFGMPLAASLRAARGIPE